MSVNKITGSFFSVPRLCLVLWVSLTLSNAGRTHFIQLFALFIEKKNPWPAHVPNSNIIPPSPMYTYLLQWPNFWIDYRTSCAPPCHERHKGDEACSVVAFRDTDLTRILHQTLYAMRLCGPIDVRVQEGPDWRLSTTLSNHSIERQCNQITILLRMEFGSNTGFGTIPDDKNGKEESGWARRLLPSWRQYEEWFYL